jgi:hypothetical protein
VGWTGVMYRAAKRTKSNLNIKWARSMEREHNTFIIIIQHISISITGGWEPGSLFGLSFFWSFSSYYFSFLFFCVLDSPWFS